MNGSPEFESRSTVDFDDFADSYDEVVSRSLAVSGEDNRFFARRRIAWLREILSRAGLEPCRVMDFGCGTGTSIPFFFDLLGATSVIGVDVSSASLGVARREHGARAVTLKLRREYKPSAEIDLAFCNGVLHHIPLAERADALDYVRRAVKPGGILALWENNPWSPGARYCMRVNPCDRDAIPLSPVESHRLVRAAGFTVMGISYLFIFPRVLSWFRWTEPLLSRLPFGAQYMLLCQARREKSS